MYRRWAWLYVTVTVTLLVLGGSEVAALAAPAVWKSLSESWLAWLLLCLSLTLAISGMEQAACVRRLRALQQVAGHLATPQSLDRALRDGLEQAMAASGAQGGIILIRESRGSLMPAARIGVSRSWSPDDSILPASISGVDVGPASRAGFLSRGAARCVKLFPLEADGELKGMMLLGWKRKSTLSVADAATLQALSACLAAACSSAVIFSRALREAMTDPLTGVSTRRSFLRVAHREIARQRREGGVITLIVLDLDRFKEINDRYGHAAGDKALRLVAHALEHTRASDLVARMGGDEFCVLLPGTDLTRAQQAAVRIREMVANICKEVGLPFEISVSIGVAQVGTDGIEAALEVADAAMYRTKRRAAGLSAAQEKTPVRAA